MIIKGSVGSISSVNLVLFAGFIITDCVTGHILEGLRLLISVTFPCCLFKHFILLLHVEPNPSQT